MGEDTRQPAAVVEKSAAIFRLCYAKLDMLKKSPSLFKGAWLEGGCSWFCEPQQWFQGSLPTKTATAGLPWDRTPQRGSPDQCPEGSLNLEVDFTDQS